MATATRGISNAEARSLFLASALRRVQMVTPSQTPALGGTMTFTLPKQGIARGCLLSFSLPVTLGTAAGVPTAKSPYNAVSNVLLTDPSGIARVNASGWSLYVRSILSDKGYEPSTLWPFTAGGPSGVDPYGAGAAYPFNIQGGGYPSKAAEGGTVSGPTYAGAGTATTFAHNIPSAVGSSNLNFFLWVPIAKSFDDPRGSLALNVPNGSTTLQVTLNNALTATSGVDTVWTSATGTAVLNAPAVTNVTCYCYVWDPVPVPGVSLPGGIPIPYDDLNLVYEYKSLIDASGLSASTTKTWTAPSGRDYDGVYSTVVENGSLNTCHLNRVQWVVDGNTIIMDEYLAGHLARLNYETGRIPPEGTIAYLFENRPYDANSYGSLGLNVITSSGFSNAGSTYIEVMTSSLYSAQMANA